MLKLNILRKFSIREYPEFNLGKNTYMIYWFTMRPKDN